MNDGQINYHFQAIRQLAIAQQWEDLAAWQEIDAVLEDLQVVFEQMQASLEAAEVVEEELFQRQQYYYDLFQFSPLAFLLTDANGLILEANQAIANLLNRPQTDLINKPLSLFIAKSDRAAFRTCLNQLAQGANIQSWQMNLSPRGSEPIAVELCIGVVRNSHGWIATL